MKADTNTVKKIYTILIMVLIVAGIISFFETKAFFERKKFTQNEVNEKIIEIKNNWTGGRSFDYITNNYKVTLLNIDTLFIGDSISKEVNTTKFSVFRKEEGNYFFLKFYDIK